MDKGPPMRPLVGPGARPMSQTTAICEAAALRNAARGSCLSWAPCGREVSADGHAIAMARCRRGRPAPGTHRIGQGSLWRGACGCSGHMQMAGSDT